MVFKNSIKGDTLLKRYVRSETIKDYVNGIEEIARRGISVKSIVVLNIVIGTTLFLTLSIVEFYIFLSAITVLWIYYFPLTSLTNVIPR